MDKQTQKKIEMWATYILSTILYLLIIGSAQEIYESYLAKQSGPGIIRLITIQIGGICRIALAYTIGPKKTLIPETILFLENTTQLTQYIYYEAVG